MVLKGLLGNIMFEYSCINNTITGLFQSIHIMFLCVLFTKLICLYMLYIKLQIYNSYGNEIRHLTSH
jgi:hypothetical protein